MLLDKLLGTEESLRVSAEAVALMQALYPICRSITGDGVRRTLDLVDTWCPIERHEVPSGTQVFDWEVPREWNIRDAYVADASGRRVIDFRDHNLHVVNYSVPVRKTLSLRGTAAASPLPAGSTRLDSVPDQLLQGKLGLLLAPPRPLGPDRRRMYDNHTVF